MGILVNLIAFKVVAYTLKLDTIIQNGTESNQSKQDRGSTTGLQNKLIGNRKELLFIYPNFFEFFL